MGCIMQYPDSWEEFLSMYEFEDKYENYTNKSMLIPSFRVKQMITYYMKHATENVINILEKYLTDSYDETIVMSNEVVELLISILKLNVKIKYKENEISERNLLAISIKHSEYKWEFGKPFCLWGSRTKNSENRSFSGYTIYPYEAEIYSLKDWEESSYNNKICKIDKPVHITTDFCNKYKNYDTVLVPFGEYILYSNQFNLPLDNNNTKQIIDPDDLMPHGQ